MGSNSILQNIYLFKTMTTAELDQIAAITESQSFGAGEPIFIKGDPAKALYVIRMGSIKIQQTSKSGDAIDVATLGSGSHFGEMAFMDGQPRSASATAADRGELVVIPYEKLNSLLSRLPPVAMKFYKEMAHFLANRLRVTTNDLSFAKEKNLSHM